MKKIILCIIFGLLILSFVSAADVTFKDGLLLNMSYGNVTTSYFKGDGSEITNIMHQSDSKLSDYNLVGYWSLNGDYLDYSGNGHAGSCTYCPTQTDGKIGRAYIFDGTNDYLQLSNATELNITTESFSISARVKRSGNSASTIPVITSKRDSSTTTNPGYQLLFAGGVISSVLCDGSTTRVKLDGTTHLNNDTWYHLAATYDRSGNMIIYINGVQEASTSITSQQGSISSSQTFKIGAERTTPSGMFNGTIDEVMVWNRSLSSNEVKVLYEASKEIASQSSCLLRQGNHYEISESNLDYPLVINDSTGGISLWASANVSAAGYIDRTSYWTGTEEKALAELTQIQGINGEIDHSSLPDFTKATFISGYNQVCNEVCGSDIELGDICWDECENIPVYSEGRDIGATTTMLVEAVKALKNENDLLREELCEEDGTYSWC